MTGTTLTVIAEAGVNHNGDMALARELVHAAAESGADMVKFQAFQASEIASRASPTAAYQKDTTGLEDQLSMLRRLEFSIDDFAEIAAHCRKAGIGFLCTPFDTAMTAALIDMGMPCIKVASGELTNTPALEHFARFGKPVLLSTGMATMDEVSEAVGTLRTGGAMDITLLHCTSLYPAPASTLNLRAMVAMRERFGLPVGYSDHSEGDEITIAAVALGATVIEKHFTLDRAMPGPDHKASLEPQELTAMVRQLRNVTTALGNGVKEPDPAEIEMARIARRSWHAAHTLAKGTTLERDDVTLKRPATGLTPGMSPIGRRLVRDVSADEPIRNDDLEAGTAR